jgi:hypothetical protein
VAWVAVIDITFSSYPIRMAIRFCPEWFARAKQRH